MEVNRHEYHSPDNSADRRRFLRVAANLKKSQLFPFWKQLNEFNEYKILEGYGSVSRKKADEKAFAEYEKFNQTQRIESDFDRMVKRLPKGDDNDQ